MRTTVLSSLVLGSLILSACGGAAGVDPGPDSGAGSGSGEPISPSCMDATSHSDLAWIQTNVFTRSCAFSGCHNGTASSAGHLVLTPGASQRNLVGMPTETEADWVRVVPGHPEQSYLLVALGDGGGPAPRDGTMPLSQPALCVEKRDAIARWIAAGAQP